MLRLLCLVCAGICQADEFPQPFDTQELTARLLAPQAAAAAFETPPGFRVRLFAGEPDVRQPIGMTFDSRGRLWVAENYTYAERSINFERALNDRIVVFEDADGDGHFDRRTVFWDRAKLLTSVEVGHGGVWALCPPQLLFLPDRNGDDVPDGEPEVVLDGFDADYIRHNLANGLRWGPDGWLYGRHGIQNTSAVGQPGTPHEQRVRLNCSIWRLHPVTRQFEVVCQGGTNSWGTDWNQYGELFFINTVIGHLWQAIPGAHYQRMYGEDLNPHVYRLIEQVADHVHWADGEKWADVKTHGISDATDAAGGGHAHCGLLFYQGDNWPAEYRHRLFTINLHGRRLNQERVERHGATYVARHEPDLLRTRDEWFRGIDLATGPDGGVFVLDWSDLGECHENDGVHRNSGRIYKITYEPDGQPPRRHVDRDLQKLSNAELVDLLKLENVWYTRQALRLLHERKLAGIDTAAIVPRLHAAVASELDAARRLRVLWALYAVGAADESWLIDRLNDPSEHIRSWAVRLLVDRGAPSSPAVRALVQCAQRESSGLVLTYLASALQKLNPADRWPIAAPLAGRDEFAYDRVLPLMVWYGIESAVPEMPEAAIALLEQSAMPVVTQFVARRLTHDLLESPQSVAALVQRLPQLDAKGQESVLTGMAEALRGLRQAPPPGGWSELAAKLEHGESEAVRELARELSVVFGDGRAADHLLRVVDDAGQSPDARRRALRALVDSRSPAVAARLPKLLSDQNMASEAIRGLMVLDPPNAAELLVARFASLRPAGRAAAVEALCSRSSYARHLLDAVARSEVDRNYVSAYQLRQLQLLGDESINQRIAELWPAARLLSADKLARISQLRGELTGERLASADLVKGRQHFAAHCAKCHKLFDAGGGMGPELTGAQRTNLEYLLENILDPSATLAANFRMSVVVMVDGRVLNGVVVERTARAIALQTPDERITIALADIDELAETELSPMPEGLLDRLTADDIADLFAYLMSPQQVPLPAAGP